MRKSVLTAAQDEYCTPCDGHRRAGTGRVNLPERLDIFSQIIAEARLDICLLFRTLPRTRQVDPLQLVLRGLCTLDRQVSHATLTPERIETRIDGIRLAFGHFSLSPDAPFFRPDLAGASLNSGRLGHLLSHHKLAIRLRIDAAASAGLIDEICHLILGLYPPTAVITLPQRLVLTRTEFQDLPRDSLDQLNRATVLNLSPPRHARPSLHDGRAEAPPGAQHSGPQGYAARQYSLFKRSHDSAAARPETDPVTCLLTDYHDATRLRALQAEFRKDRRWTHLPRKGTGHRPGFLQPESRPRKPARDVLICDAVVIAYGGRMRHCLAPILLATLVALISYTYRAHGPDDHHGMISSQPLPDAYSA